MSTLKDLSRHLGISVTQVSRALNGHDDVSEDTKKRVRKAAKLLNYIPNMSARKLVSGRSGVVALVQRNNRDLIEDHNFIETVTNLSIEFSKLGKQFVLHIAPEDADEISVYQRLIAGGALDGFVVHEPANHDPRVEFLTSNDIPFVVHGRTMGELTYPFFDIDNFEVGYQLTKHLLDRGHRRIALINGPEGLTYATLRLHGYQKALSDYGVSYDPSLVKFGRMTEELGLVKTIEINGLISKFPTAIVAGHVRIAKGIYQAAEALGLHIPSDLSVVSHDDVIPKLRASTFYPALTVTRSGLRNSWEPLARYLSQSLDGQAAEELQSVSSFEFVTRTSTADAT
jgi:LacI family transcriptional regulator